MAKCGLCHETGVSVAHVRDCYAGAGFTGRVEQTDHAAGRVAAPVEGAGVRTASAKQVAFVTKLMQERHPEADWQAAADIVIAAGGAAVSKAIDALLATPKPKAAARPPAAFTPPRNAPVEMGMYRKADGTMYRVYPARAGGHLLAKKLTTTPDGFEFQYAGAAQRFVSADERMTLEEAKAFGHQFGICCVCAALLTDPVSVEAGIGPICGGRV